MIYMDLISGLQLFAFIDTEYLVYVQTERCPWTLRAQAGEDSCPCVKDICIVPVTASEYFSHVKFSAFHIYIDRISGTGFIAIVYLEYSFKRLCMAGGIYNDQKKDREKFSHRRMRMYFKKMNSDTMAVAIAEISTAPAAMSLTLPARW